MISFFKNQTLCYSKFIYLARNIFLYKEEKWRESCYLPNYLKPLPGWWELQKSGAISLGAFSCLSWLKFQGRTRPRGEEQLWGCWISSSDASNTGPPQSDKMVAVLLGITPDTTISKGKRPSSAVRKPFQKPLTHFFLCPLARRGHMFILSPSLAGDLGKHD